MALVAADRPRVQYAMGMSSIPVLELDKATGTTFKKGAVVIFTSGLIVEAADGPSTGTVVGIAAEDADSGQTLVHVWPALPNIIFTGNVATGDSGATVASAATDKGTAYGMAVNSSIWYVNKGDTSDLLVMIVKLVDAAATAWGQVDFFFMDSIWVAEVTD
jgi:hypothetical protein